MSMVFAEAFSLLPIIVIIIIFANAKKRSQEARNAGPMQSLPREAAHPAQRPVPAVRRSGNTDAARYADDNPSAAQRRQRARSSQQARDVSKAATGRVEKASSIRNMDSILMEDRKNDWLARQIREENRIKARGDFWDLGAAHDKDCDARDLKREHVLVHDDSIDNGEL